MNIEEAENNLNYTFKDKTLLKRALTLPSADCENSNQTLEFFGDAILEFLVSEKIYDANASEGKLTDRRKALVSDSALEPVSRRLKLDKFLIKSQSDANNKKAIPSAYEAVVAAIYLDGGMDEARKFVLSTLDFSNAPEAVNYKGELQEFLQQKGESCPVYTCVTLGTPQKAEFEVTVTVFGKTYSGKADGKKRAEHIAAQAAMKDIKEQK